MRYFTGFGCVACSGAHARDQDLLSCPACDKLLAAEYNYDRLAREVDRDSQRKLGQRKLGQRKLG